MAIIVYPADGWNSFISVAEATDDLNLIGGGTEWGALTLLEQEQMLVKSALLLVSVAVPNGICNFIGAQVLLLQFDLQNGGKYLSFVTTSESEYKRAKVGPLEVEYNIEGEGGGMAGGVSGLPDMVTGMIADCLLSGDNRVTGFKLVF